MTWPSDPISKQLIYAILLSTGGCCGTLDHRPSNLQVGTSLLLVSWVRFLKGMPQIPWVADLVHFRADPGPHPAFNIDRAQFYPFIIFYIERSFAFHLSTVFCYVLESGFLFSVSVSQNVGTDQPGYGTHH
jgi:hypothetical protein